MKKIISSTLILAALAVSFTGCLKDKGFENHTYGINDPDTQPPGVGFPKAVASKVTIGVELDPNPQTVNDLVFVNVLAMIQILRFIRFESINCCHHRM